MLAQPNEITNLNVFKEVLDREGKDPYRNSAFLPIKQLSSKAKGAICETIVEEYFSKKNYKVTKASNSDHDRIIDGKKVEIKSSFMWINKKTGQGTHFRWQQIRTNQDYDIVCFVAFYPDRVEFWGATKEQSRKFLEVQDTDGNWIYNQHGGKKVNSGTFCIDGFPEDFPWFTNFEELL